MKPLIQIITNYVTINDVANGCVAVGARPIMSNAIEEMSEVIAKVDGLILNLGTITKERVALCLEGLKWAQKYEKPVLLDPVGCGVSQMRLSSALKLLETGTVHVLKVNPNEARALISQEVIDDQAGIDSQKMGLEEKKVLCQRIYKKYNQEQGLIVVITGSVDVISSDKQQTVVEGGANLQQSIVGTGCMLNPIIMSYLLKCQDISHRHKMIVRAIKHMNWASEQAKKSLSDWRNVGTYKQRLIDYLSVYNKRMYLITDYTMDFETELLPKTERVLKQGIDVCQYRKKEVDYEQGKYEALQLQRLTKKENVLFIINDDVNLAKEIDADGVHLGQMDMACKDARHILGKDKWIGVTAKTVEQALEAEAEGADYLGVGALYTSPTKQDAKTITIAMLKEIYLSTTIPVFGIGGLKKENITDEIDGYTDGLVMVSGIYTDQKRFLSERI